MKFMKMSNELGRYIRRTRQLSNLPLQQKDVARQSRVSKTFYSEIERGLRFPSYNKLVDICRILGIAMTTIEPIAKEEIFKRWKGKGSDDPR